MADISAKDVAALRKITGAGMMDCKKALLENDGDFERAKDWLREKGIAGAAKREGRAADQGAIEVLVDGNVGAIVELNCETDFVAKGDVFKRGAVGARRGSSSTKATPTSASKKIDGETVDDFVKGLSGTLGEKIELGRVVPLRDDRRSARRVQAHAERARHHRRARRARRRRPRRREGARGRARHRAAHRRARRRATSPATRSRPTTSRASATIYEAQTREEGKPEQAWPKIVEGKLNGFFKTVALRRAVVREGQQADDRRAGASRSAPTRTSAASHGSKIGEE